MNLRKRTLKPQVHKVECSALPYERILKVNYEKIREKFLLKHGRPLPAWYNLPREDRDQLRVFMDDAWIKIYLKSGKVLLFKIKAGWFTDLASVPKILRSLVDNDDARVVIAAIVHDTLFAAKLAEVCEWDYNPMRPKEAFRFANYLFREIIEEQDGGFFLRNAAYIAVASPFGWRVYKNKRIKKTLQERGFVSMEWIDDKKRS